MLRLLLFLVFVGCSRGDPMLDVLYGAGARRASVCAAPAGAGAGAPAGCAGAVWARYWLLARASCVSRAGAARAPVLLDRSPEDCQHVNFDSPPGGIQSLVHFVHPGYAPPAIDDWEDPEPDPLDAALILLSAPAPPTRADNHTATCDLLPELSSWLRYVPAQVPWTSATAPPPPPHRAPALLSSPLGMLLSTIVAPVAALLLTFVLLLRWPQEADEQPTDEKVLVESDALCGEAA